VQVAVLAAAQDQDLDGKLPRGARLPGSVITSVTPPRRAASSRSASGGINTATAPSRDRAAIATSAEGRVSISTPTRTPWRTPT
jgi:hypothetical protein